jgi:ATP-binding cassette, subfamily B, bacterial
LSDAELLDASRDLAADKVLAALRHGYLTQPFRMPVQPQEEPARLPKARLSRRSRGAGARRGNLAVDGGTECRIQAALRRLCEGSTAQIIAHRLATARNADRIAAIRDGRIVEVGAHDT